MNKRMLFLPIVLISMNIFGVGDQPSAKKPSLKMRNLDNLMQRALEYVPLQKELFDTVLRHDDRLRKLMYRYLIQTVGVTMQQYEKILHNFDERERFLEELYQIRNSIGQFYTKVNDKFELLIDDNADLNALDQTCQEFFVTLLDYAEIRLNQGLTTPEQVRAVIKDTSNALEVFRYIKYEFEYVYNSMR